MRWSCLSIECQTFECHCKKVVEQYFILPYGFPFQRTTYRNRTAEWQITHQSEERQYASDNRLHANATERAAEQHGARHQKDRHVQDWSSRRFGTSAHQCNALTQLEQSAIDWCEGRLRGGQPKTKAGRRERRRVNPVLLPAGSHCYVWQLCARWQWCQVSVNDGWLAWCVANSNFVWFIMHALQQCHWTADRAIHDLSRGFGAAKVGNATVDPVVWRIGHFGRSVAVGSACDRNDR